MPIAYLPHVVDVELSRLPSSFSVGGVELLLIILFELPVEPSEPALLPVELFFRPSASVKVH